MWEQFHPTSVSAEALENPFLWLRPHSPCPVPVAEAAETEIAEGKAAMGKQEQGGEVVQPWELWVQGESVCREVGSLKPHTGMDTEIHSSQGSQSLPLPMDPGQRATGPIISFPVSPPWLALVAQGSMSPSTKEPWPTPSLVAPPLASPPVLNPCTRAAQALGMALFPLQPREAPGSMQPGQG